jgi:hypothetical protein
VVGADCNRFLITTHTKYGMVRIVQCLCAVGPRGKGGCLCIGVTLTQTLRPARRQCTFQARAAPRTVSLTVAPARHCQPCNNHARRGQYELVQIKSALSGSTLQLVGLCPQSADTNADAGRPAVRILPSRRSWPGPSKAGGERAQRPRGMRRAWCDVSQQDV